MPEESPRLLPPAEESLAADAEPAAAPEPEPAEPAPEPMAEPSFVCECEEWMRSVCKDEPFYKEHEGKRFCVLHYPGKEKSVAFEIALQKKLEAGDFDFRGVWFPEAANFGRFEFSASANFRFARFNAEANFGFARFNAEADFFSATFSALADFRFARFNASAPAYFSYTTFNAKAYFHATAFSAEMYFNSATFSTEAYFNSTIFGSKASFNSVTFKDQVSFSGNNSFDNQSAFDLQFARIENPERVSFHTVMLRPHWFVNIDPRKFVFTDVSFDWNAISIESEIQSLEAKYIPSPHQLLAIACRQLAENAEANNRYEEASKFRYWAMDLARIYKWKELEMDWLHVLYWAVSGYGERILRAFVWLLAVWIVFALLYTQVDFTNPEGQSETPTADPVIAEEPDSIDQSLPIKRAFTYSLGVMSLQRPEPKPLTGKAQTLVTLETILGPLQAALLALAIRRKFMR